MPTPENALKTPLWMANPDGLYEYSSEQENQPYAEWHVLHFLIKILPPDFVRGNRPAFLTVRLYPTSFISVSCHNEPLFYVGWLDV